MLYVNYGASVVSGLSRDLDLIEVPEKFRALLESHVDSVKTSAFEELQYLPKAQILFTNPPEDEELDIVPWEVIQRNPFTASHAYYNMIADGWPEEVVKEVFEGVEVLPVEEWLERNVEVWEKRYEKITEKGIGYKVFHDYMVIGKYIFASMQQKIYLEKNVLLNKKLDILWFADKIGEQVWYFPYESDWRKIYAYILWFVKDLDETTGGVSYLPPYQGMDISSQNIEDWEELGWLGEEVEYAVEEWGPLTVRFILDLTDVDHEDIEASDRLGIDGGYSVLMDALPPKGKGFDLPLPGFTQNEFEVEVDWENLEIKIRSIKDIDYYDLMD